MLSYLITLGVAHTTISFEIFAPTAVLPETSEIKIELWRQRL